MNVKAKWILVAFAIGLLVGAGAVLYFVFRPASTTITELREQSEQAAAEYRVQVESYHRLLQSARGRAKELAESLAAEAADHQRSIDRVGRLEGRIKELESIGRAESEADSRVLDYNRRIGEEATEALRELREYCAALEGSSFPRGKGDPPTED